MKKWLIYGISLIIMIVLNVLALTKFKDTTFEDKISLINTIYIIVIYFTDKIIEASDKENDNKKYWFKNFILEKYIYDYCNFFDLGADILRDANRRKNELVENNLGAKDLKEISTEITHELFDKFSLGKRKITSINGFIQIYDNKVYLKVQNLIEEYQNRYTEMLENQLNNVSEHVEKDVNEVYNFQNKLLEIFYKHSMKL